MILLLLLYYFIIYFVIAFFIIHSMTFYAGIHITLTVFFYILFVCVQVHVGECVPWCMFEGQRTTCRSWFCPPTMWVPVITLRSSGLSAGAFTQWAISLALFGFLLFLRQGLKYPWTQNVTEDNLELLIFLVIPSKCWDYRHGLCMTHRVLDIKLTALRMLGKHSTNWTASQARGWDSLTLAGCPSQLSYNLIIPHSRFYIYFFSK